MSSRAEKMDRVTLEYCGALQLVTNNQPHYFRPLMRYLLAVSSVKTIKDIIVVERPYKTNIHPEVFSAMSYDPRKSGPTPSTVAFSRVLSLVSDIPVETAEEWFRDGWRYLSSGVVLLNVCYAGNVTDTRFQREVVYFQEYLRGVLLTLVRAGESGITVYGVGNKAIHAVSRVMSSIGEGRSNVTFKKIDSPLTIIHRPGDGTSRHFTEQNKGGLKSLCGIVLRTLAKDQDCATTALTIMEAAKNETKEAGSNLVQRLNDVRRYIKEPTRLQEPTADDAISSVIDGLTLFSTKLAKLNMSMDLHPRESDNRVAKAAAFGEKRPPSSYPKSASSIAASSQYNAVSVRRPLGGFDDEDDGGTSGNHNLTIPVARSKTVKLSGFDDSDESTPATPTQTDPKSVAGTVPAYMREVAASIYDLKVVKGAEWLREALGEVIHGRPVSGEVRSVVEKAYDAKEVDNEKFFRDIGLLSGTTPDNNSDIMVFINHTISVHK